MIYEFKAVVELKISGKTEIFNEEGYAFGETIADATASLINKYEEAGATIKNLTMIQIKKGKILIEKSVKAYENCSL